MLWPEMRQPNVITRRRLIVVLAIVLVPIALFIGGVGYAVWWLYDNVGAPGPSATGSGPCSSADAVNIQMVFADGRTVQACTHDRPPCHNQNSGQIAGVSQFGIRNQLRSSSRRYILNLDFDGALPAEAVEQTLKIDPAKFLPDQPGSGTGILSAAVIQVTPRDPTQDGYTPSTGTVTVSSSHGVARGQIDGSLNVGPTRPDRPAPSSNVPSPVRITGTFACNH
jgi:nitrate reductase NapE component